MPNKDNIKQFSPSSGSKSKSSGATKKKPSSTSKKKTVVKAKKPAYSEYREIKREIDERHKIENIQNKEEKRLIRNENKRIRKKKHEENKIIRAQKRKDRKAIRKEGIAYTFSDKVINEVMGVGMIGLGIFLFMCNISDATGIVGEIFKEIMHGAFGYLAYVLPFAVIIGGVFVIINSSKQTSVKIGKVIFTIVGVYLFLMFLQLFPYSRGKFDDDTFSTFFYSTYSKGIDGIGVGVVASMGVYWLVLCFGMAGSRLLLFLGVVVCLLAATNRSINKMTDYLIKRLKEKEKTRKEKIRVLQRSEMHPINTRPQQTQTSAQQRPSRPAEHQSYSEPPISGFNRKPRPEPQQEIYDEEPIQEVYAQPVEESRPAKLHAEKTEQKPRKSNIISLNGMARKPHQEENYSQDEERPVINEMTQLDDKNRPLNVTVDGEILEDETQSVAAPVDGVEETQYIFPSLDLLELPSDNNLDPLNEEEVYQKAKAIEQTLSDFGIAAKVNNITHGPVITRYECSVPSGTKMSKVTSLDKELAYSLECASIRIEAPIPGKAAIGIEVPNEIKSTVYLRELLESPEFVKKESLLAFAVGKDIAGNIIIGDIAKMPHTLICGATGSGKSVFVNGILMSLLYKASPMDVKLIMVDPKKVEFEKYRGIPHLLFPVVSNPKRAAGVLAWCVKEMEDRYEKMAKVGVRDLRGYNKLMRSSPSDDPDLQPLPLIVIVIDELSDLMVVARDEVEDHIYRLAQMARAAGMYLLIATQRPSVDVVTGVIKANIPSRIALKTSSPQDSRTILNTIGAEQLLGNGDMIYKPQGLDRSLRVQGAWVSDDEVEKVVEFVRSQNFVSQTAQTESLESKITEIDKKFVEASATDELLNEAIAFVVKEQEASVSMLQRRFRIGHGRAGNLIDEMEKRGVVGPHIGSKPREVLLSREEYEIGFTPEDKRDTY